MNLTPGHRLAYQISAETYWAVDGETPTIHVQSIREGEADWEFAIEGDVDGDPGLKVVVFSDAFGAFAEAPEVFTALRQLSEIAPATLPNVLNLLNMLGAIDITVRTATTRVNPIRGLARVSDTLLG